jgi:hypothetical protein
MVELELNIVTLYPPPLFHSFSLDESILTPPLYPFQEPRGVHHRRAPLLPVPVRARRLPSSASTPWSPASMHDRCDGLSRRTIRMPPRHPPRLLHRRLRPTVSSHPSPVDPRRVRLAGVTHVPGARILKHRSIPVWCSRALTSRPDKVGN